MCCYKNIVIGEHFFGVRERLLKNDSEVRNEKVKRDDKNPDYSG